MIKISNLSNKKNGNNYSFADFHLDMEATQVSRNKTNDDIVPGNDIMADHDEKAIINSISNILLQRRYLTPTFSTNLRKYLGKPISDMAARSLGEDIEKGIALFERRIKVKKILVMPDINQNLYQIYLLISMPNFSNKVIALDGQLNSNGKLYFLSNELI